MRQSNEQKIEILKQKIETASKSLHSLLEFLEVNSNNILDAEITAKTTKNIKILIAKLDELDKKK